MKMTPEEKNQVEEILSKAHGEYEKGLNTYAYFKISNHQTGEDLVQDTFLKTWSYILKGGKINMMKPFLYHVLNNLIIDQYRKKKTVSLDTLSEKGFEPSEDKKDTLIDMLDGRELMSLIKELPIKYRVLMDMRYIKDFSIEEISENTKQSKATVAVQLHRGLKILKILCNK